MKHPSFLTIKISAKEGYKINQPQNSPCNLSFFQFSDDKKEASDIERAFRLFLSQVVSWQLSWKET